MANGEYLAHIRKEDGEKQTVENHLSGVAKLSGFFASKIGLEDQGELLGLLHDLGKYSDAFQRYLKSAGGLIDPDEDDYIHASGKRGKIDHSTAGGQLIWETLLNGSQGKKDEWIISAQIFSLCILSHHSGLINCLAPDGNDTFTERIEKDEGRTHLPEAFHNMESELRNRALELLAHPDIVITLISKLKEIHNRGQDSPTTTSFKQGLLVRFLFSCLIDADRLDTANFEDPRRFALRNESKYQPWHKLIERLELKLGTFEQTNRIDVLRRQVSDDCRSFAEKGGGIYTLTVPTGGGKTLASLRFALHHAKKHGLDRIIYVIPYTSIIDQNADQVRKILEDRDVDGNYSGRVVLEHHSNLTPDEENAQQKVLAEDWDAPVVFTTSVQVLESLFGSGTRSVRRFHQLARSVIIFDEIQTIPVRSVHMFNNAINFLASNCGSTVVLCTATQPLLNAVDKRYGALNFPTAHEIMPDVGTLFTELRRVEILDRRKPGGWTSEEVAKLAVSEQEEVGSALVIVNTRKAALELFTKVLELDASADVYHLSTKMCPAHRLSILERVRSCLDHKMPKPVLCISTQLIEAGVDVDFGSAIRSVAGLDSIAQAAGRCNRHGRRDSGRVFILNPDFENLNELTDIKIGKQKAERFLDEFAKAPERWQQDRLSPKAIDQYFKYYFYERASEMHHPVYGDSRIGIDTDLLSLLSTNLPAVKHYAFLKQQAPKLFLRQSFLSASKAFLPIDSPTRGIIVPYGDGKSIIDKLCSTHSYIKDYSLIHYAQRYSVNLFPWEWKQMEDNGMIYEVHEGTGIYYLAYDKYYNQHFGLETSVSTQPFLQA